MKSKLSKICSLLPFGIYAVLLLIYFKVNGLVFLGMFLFSWILSLAASVLGIVFSALTLKERLSKLCLCLSVVNAVVGIIWGLFAFTLTFCSAWIT